MGHENVSEYLWGPPDVCPSALILPIFDERSWSPALRITLYFIALLYFFLGVSIITDIFMSSIETITSKTRKIYMAKTISKKQNGSYNAVMDGVVAGLKEDEPEVVEVRVWNDTVANLTLMALGTSAPEILLSIIEIIGHHFEAGELGPGTIVGSAAFNLLFITSICMLSLDGDDTRRISRFKVFLVTGIFAFSAYIWLYLILMVISPEVVEIWESLLTFVLFPVLVFFAFSADKGWCGLGLMRQRNKQQLELGPLRDEETEKAIAERNFFREGKLDRESLVKFVREVKKYPGISDEDAAILAAAKLVDSQPHSAMWYRIGAVRSMSGSRNLKPMLSMKLKQVYDVINEHPKAPDLGDLPPAPDTDKYAVIEFHSATVAVRENIGKFAVTIYRRGNIEPEIRVRVQTIDGSACSGEDYIPIDESITFNKNEREKQVVVQIVNDNKWEPNEEFFLRLSLLQEENEDVKLGRISIMEVTIIDDDDPGIFQFEKRGMIVKESAGCVQLPVVRTRGADGDVTVKWRTIDKSAISGRDYKGGTGVLEFKHGETRQILDIPIINDYDAEKDEHFEVELHSPSPAGARIGNINRVAITISNDDDFNNMMDRLMVMTNTNIDAIRVHKKTWGLQIREAMLVKGGDIENATTADYILHFFSFFWKILFALVPPPGVFGGWLCFIISLACIGVMTALIGDIASMFGCLVGLEDTMTAITLVALGTSMPDTIASRMALVNGKYADDAIGNIFGSNSVNIFLGLGLPWSVASLYHFSKGSTFIVPASGLGFSVLMYAIAAILAMILLLARRNLSMFGKAEIGGPAPGRYFSAGFLVLLWVLYIVLSYLQIQKVIQVDF